MRSHPVVLVLVLALATTLASTACRRGSDPAPAVEMAHAQPVVNVAPTEERLLKRANERWSRIVAKDWSAAYEYSTADERASLPLERFLERMQYHEYSTPRVESVVAVEGDEAYTRALVTWKPVGNCKMHVLGDSDPLSDCEPSLEIEMLESWRRVDGEWFYVRAQRPDEFFEEHLDLRRPR
ncbi:MAG: hypothetical protein IPJ77_07025 [Planctomycetes bacterium]|nr:hypothetical protein [Planctomycetota bacterium]